MPTQEIQRIMQDCFELPIFELIRPDGHKYAFYLDGSTEGFPKDGYIVNRALPMFNVLRSLSVEEKDSQTVAISGD
jgi:hypothetical protein